MSRASGTDGVEISDEQTIFNAATDGGACVTIGVRVHSDSAAPVAVRIRDPKMHGLAWVRIPAGEKEYFRLGSMNPLGHGFGGIQTVEAKGIGGTATIDWWVAASSI